MFSSLRGILTLNSRGRGLIRVVLRLLRRCGGLPGLHVSGVEPPCKCETSCVAGRQQHKQRKRGAGLGGSGECHARHERAQGTEGGGRGLGQALSQALDLGTGDVGQHQVDARQGRHEADGEEGHTDDDDDPGNNNKDSTKAFQILFASTEKLG